MLTPCDVQDDEKAGLLDDGDSFRVQDSDTDITITGSVNQYKVRSHVLMVPRTCQSNLQRTAVDLSGFYITMRTIIDLDS